MTTDQHDTRILHDRFLRSGKQAKSTENERYQGKNLGYRVQCEDHFAWFPKQLSVERSSNCRCLMVSECIRLKLMSIVIGLSDYRSKKNEAVVAEKEALANILLHQPKFLRQKHAHCQ
jgi:hypothetical protein